ncbi:hypothetical protein BDC45DRAFT_518259 [Circinella umbellata]|nr:hypothetical protein BDC45DRAFT_518259 [Circinella umbellata]
MNQFEVLSNDTVEPASNESEVFRFTSLVPDARITLHEKKQDSDEYERFDVERYPPTVSLLACSSKFGYYVAASLKGFVYGSTKGLRDTIKNLEKGSTGPLSDKIEVPIPQGPVHQLRITADQTEIIVVVADGLVLIYNAKNIVEQKENVSPTRSFQLNGDVIDIRPNPEALPELAAVILNDNKCMIIDLLTGSTTAEIGDGITAICWSPKGKQIVCGRNDGQLVPYDSEGIEKTAIGLPAELQNKQPLPNVLGVLWIESHVFLVIYGKNEGADEDDPSHVAYIVDRKSKPTGTLQYVLLDEVTGVFGDERGPKMFMELIPNFSSDMKYAAILGNTASTDFSVVGQDENGDWATYILPENGLAMMPLSDTDQDTYPVGMALDFSVSEELPPYDSSISNEGVKPMPALYYLNDEDHIGVHYCYQETLAKNGEKYGNMVVAQDVQSGVAAAVPEPTVSTSSTATTEAPKTESTKQSSSDITTQQQSLESTKPTGFTTSAFGSALQSSDKQTDSFASLLSGSETTSSDSTSAPATGAFGAATSGSGSGGLTSFRNLGMSTSASPATAPKFGTSTLGGAAPSFGSTSFGQPSGDTPTQQQSFASLAKSTTPSATTSSTGGLFGSSQATSTPAFGSTSFGSTQASTTPAFGSTSFGSTQASTTPVFGSTGFGSTQPSSATKPFGSTSFGSPAASTTSTASGFAELAKQSKPGAFGTAPAPTSGFGSAGFGQTSFGSALSSSTSTPSTGGGGFASLAKQPNAPSKIPVPSSGTFGSSTPFGNTSTSSAPTFGSTTPFGLTPKSGAITGTPIKSTTTVPTPTPTPSESEKAKPETVPVKEEPVTTPSEPVDKEESKKEEDEKKPATTSFSSFGASTTTTTTQPASTSFGFGSFGSTTTKTEEKKEEKPASTSFGFGNFGSTLPTSTSTTTPKTEASSGFFGKAATTETEKEDSATTPKSLFAGLKGSTTTTTATDTKSAETKNLFSGISVGSSSPAKPATTSGGFLFGASGTTTSGTSFSSPLSEPTTTETTKKPSLTASPLTSGTPATSPSQPATSTFTTKTSQNVPPKKTPFVPEIPELTAKDSMAREFELAYHNMNNEFKKLAVRQEEFAAELKQHQKLQPSAKSMRDLDQPLDSWRIGDVDDLRAIADKIMDQAKSIEPQIADLSKSVEYFQNDLEKLETKKNVIEDMKDKEKDPELQKELDKRGLDKDTAKKWERIQTRAKEYGKLLSDLENKVHDAKKRNKSPAASAYDTKFPSLYSLHVALRDIESDLRNKHDQVQQIENQLARLQFKKTHAKAKKSSSRISFDDYDTSDDEHDDEEKEEQVEAHINSNKSKAEWSQSSVEYTIKYLRRERFFDKLHQFQEFQE